MDADVCIVGGGLVGLVCSLVLARQGRRVKLLEAMDFNPPIPLDLDARSIALSWSTVKIFESLGVWQELKNKASAISSIHVSSAGHFGITRLKASELELNAMGYVIEYHLLNSVLLNAVNRQPEIELNSPARVTSVTQHNAGVSIKYQADESKLMLSASLLVVADGAGSSVRDMLGINSSVTDYKQSAIVTNLKIKQTDSGCAFERFTMKGPLALLPLPNQRYALVWTNSLSSTDALLQMPEDEFLQQLHEVFGYRLGVFEQVGSRVSFALKLTRADRLTEGRAVLIGNAANSLHPVAGQGFNLALRDIGGLYDLLDKVDLTSEKLSSRLDRFQLSRVKDQDFTVENGHRLVQLFSNNTAVLNHLRAGALATLDLCSMLKKEVSWRGMGFGSGCSSLMRGTE